MSSTGKRTSSSSSENQVSRPNVVNQKSGSRISALVNFFLSSFPPRKLGLGFIAEPIIRKLLQLLINARCSKKIAQSPPEPIAKRNLLEDITFFDAVSDLGDDDNVNITFFDAVSDLDDDDDDVVDDVGSSNLVDPQLCDDAFYEHLRLSEAKKRPATDYMERVQSNGINAAMRAILIDWLVEVVGEFRLLPETLYLAVNCIDRYLSGNVVAKLNLQLLGVSCMMISAKYEGGFVCVSRFVDITDNTYTRDELLEMESCVLSYLKFELTTPTANCFLSRFVRAAAQGKKRERVPSSLLFESLASYLCEISLLDYAMLRYAPSLVAASAVFLARYVLDPSRKPWSTTLERYTRYRGSDLEACVKNLLRMCRESPHGVFAVRKKYSLDKYESAAKQSYPTSLPQELFL